MNTDFRLSIGIFEHPKVRKLKRQLGAEGVLGFLCLLRFTAQNKPDGDLAGMDADDIALAADYDGDPAAFVNTLTALRLLDGDGDGLRVHDWQEHNPYAASAPARSEKAKNAADRRWAKSSIAETASEYAHIKNGQCSEHDLALPVASISNAPSFLPSPSPSPTSLRSKTPASPEKSARAKTKPTARQKSPVDEFPPDDVPVKSLDEDAGQSEEAEPGEITAPSRANLSAKDQEAARQIDLAIAQHRARASPTFRPIAASLGGLIPPPGTVPPPGGVNGPR